jgi:GntP family gluconate:H+ symporter
MTENGIFVLSLLVLAVGFIILMTAKVKMNAFLALLLAAFGVGVLSGMDALEVIRTVTGGFGSILGYIGIVIIAGTIIGTILEKARATVSMANAVLRLIGKARSALAMSITGAVVSIPVFCDSGFVILSSLNRTLAARAGLSMTAMAVALSTGLYATHTFVPPTPGPIAAAGNLGADLGLVILFGLIASVPAVAAGYLWAMRSGRKYPVVPTTEAGPETEPGALPGVWTAFAPIVVPIMLISLKSVADFPGEPLGGGGLKRFFDFFGDPTVALLLGVFISFRLIPRWDEEHLNGWVGEGLRNAAAIVMITGAGGAFGAILKATQIGDFLGASLSQFHLGIFLPFIIAAAMKTAQGSTTVALVTTSALLAPLLPQLGLDSEVARALTVTAIGAGGMVMSHANDSYFWVVSQFSGLGPDIAYRTHSMATLIQGITSIFFIFFLSVLLV